MTAPGLRHPDDGQTPVVALVGHPRPHSPTAALARRVADRLAATLWSIGSLSAQALDLAVLAESLGVPLGADTATRWAGPLDDVRAAHVLVVASPVSRGSYSGLLKAFLDQLEAGELGGRVAIPLMTPADPAHTLAVDVHLRPLLLELGASVPSRSLVVLESRTDDPAVVTDWLAAEVPVLRRHVDPTAGVAGRLVPRRPDAHLPV